jgi:hypothetical protein
MRPFGVCVLIAAIAATVPVADAAVAPPRCWKGTTGCTHTATPHWNVKTFTGTVSVVGTRSQALTCADATSGPREEIVAGRYIAKFTLDKGASQTRVGANAQRQPTTSKPLKLVFNVKSTTHERVRTLTPAGDGNCTETFRDCDKTDSSRATDRLDVFVRSRRVVQETPGDFVKSRLLECAATPTMASFLPGDPLDGKFMSEPTRPAAFQHRDTVVTHARDHQIGDGNTSINVSGRVTYGRSIRACTRYPLTKPRCRTAHG